MRRVGIVQSIFAVDTGSLVESGEADTHVSELAFIELDA